MSVTGQQRIPTLTLTAVLRLFTSECPELGLWLVKSFFTGLMKESASIMSLTVIFFAHLFDPELDAKLQIKIFGGNKTVPHTVEIVGNWLNTKSDGRVISNKMTHVWPPCSPYLSPLDFWFWGHAMHHLKTTKPLTIEQLTVDVKDFASQLDQETVKKAVKDIIFRAGCCLDNGGSAFESKLKAYKRIH